MTRLMLRFIAIAIAIGGLIDPVFTTTGRARARLALIVQDGATMELPARGMSRREVAERVRDRLARDLRDVYDIQPRLTSDAEGVVVIGDRYPARPPRRLKPDAVVATVTVADEVSPNVRIVRVDAPREVPAGTSIRIGVDLEGLGVAGQTSMLVARVAGASSNSPVASGFSRTYLDVTRTSHQWQADRERWHADIDAVPVGEPPFVVRVEAPMLEMERTAIDNAADALVDLRRAPLRVEVYEPRPSWATTFLRRALEADARFHVASLSSTSRSISTRTSDAVSLSDSALERFEVVIVGGLDRLTEADGRVLERFMRVRGGAVVLVPDARLDAGPARTLLQGVTPVERLSEQPEKLSVVAPLPPIQASELLLMRSDVPFTDRVAWIAGADPSTVIASMPRGDGRLVWSGALDAWRFRADDRGAFDRFWQSTIAGVALAVPPAIDVSVAPPILKPGERGEVVVRVRERGPVRASVDGRPIRLWPEPETGVFRGSFVAFDTGGRSTVIASAGDRSQHTASRPVDVAADARRPLPTRIAPLALLSASHRGIDVAPDKVAALEPFIRQNVVAPAAPVPHHPMRSVWWIVPFAACLSAEWWLRRRRGAR